MKLCPWERKGRRRVHSGPPSVECNFVCLLEQAAEQNRTDTADSAHLSISSSSGRKGGAKEDGKEGKGRRGEVKDCSSECL